jgi:hypothetical protein
MNEFELYPNPSVDFLIVNNGNFSSYEVVNSAGVSVQKGDVNGNKIDVKNLETGNYFIHLNGQNQIQTGRFTKM